MIRFCLIFLLALQASAQVKKFKTTAASNERFFGITLSRNAKTAFFVDSRGGRDTLTLVQSVFKDGVWQKPTPVLFSNKPGVWKDIDPFLSPNDSILLFNSNRPTTENPKKGDFDIWAVNKTSSGWGEPYNLGNVINSEASDYFATMSRHGNIYFSSTRQGGSGKADIYVSKLEHGKYQPPVNLGSPINTEMDEGNPYVSPDEDYLIYVINDKPGGFGDSDLYISFNQNGIWSRPVNLGEEINTKDAEFAPFVKNNTLYFGRIIRGKPLKESIYFTKLHLRELRISAKLGK